MESEIGLEFPTSLLTWFVQNARDFPWRQTHDPYAVLLAEKLLQQTSARKNIANLYSLLLTKYPTILDLANAEITELKSIIKPLGFAYRAREIIIMSQQVLDRYGGLIPNDLEKLLSLHGVGDYTARAVLSFAFGEDVPVVDTNIARILFRIFDLKEKYPANPARSRKLLGLMAELFPQGKSKQFNWAMIDLGAMICKQRKPACTECPVNQFCGFYLQNQRKNNYA